MSHVVATYAIMPQGSSLLRATHTRDSRGDTFELATPTGDVVATEFHEHDQPAARTFQAFVVDQVLSHWNRGRAL